MIKLFKKKKIYLDYAGATPVNPKVARITSFYQKKFFANPSAIHQVGVKAKKIIEEARTKIASLINAHADEIIFTGSGTESDALSIMGIINNYELRITNGDSKKIIPHIVTTNIEHPAVLENCKLLEKSGKAEVTHIPVKENGIVDPKDIKEALKENTVLVSVMYANNEIGTIEPIQEIAKIIRHFKKNKYSKEHSLLYPIFHTDACQAMNYLFTENIEKLGVDLMTFNGSKIYGPKGTGVLYKKRGIGLVPLYAGGGQEFGLRSGTENVTGIAGLALALEEVSKIKERESARLIGLRDYAIEKLLNLKVPPFKIILNGDVKERLPNNINISISDISSELLVIELDALGIQVSEKSACHSESDGISHVIKAIRQAEGKEIKKNEGSLRISFGQQTTKKDIDYLISSLIRILEKYIKYR